MIKIGLSVAAIGLLSTAALAQTLPARPDLSVNSDRPAMGTVSPVPAPDASTRPGQEQGNRDITNKNRAGADNTSKPGTPGLPGSKSGPTMTKGGTKGGATESSGTSTPTQQQDESKVPGMKGSKSGPSEK